MTLSKLLTLSGKVYIYSSIEPETSGSLIAHNMFIFGLPDSSLASNKGQLIFPKCSPKETRDGMREPASSLPVGTHAVMGMGYAESLLHGRDYTSMVTKRARY